VPLAEWLEVLCRQQSNVMPKRCKLPPNGMSTSAGPHADKASRQIGQMSLSLTTRQLLPQQNLAAPIHADHVERVLA
jgi:hypothetical protein